MYLLPVGFKGSGLRTSMSSLSNDAPTGMSSSINLGFGGPLHCSTNVTILNLQTRVFTCTKLVQSLKNPLISLFFPMMSPTVHHASVA